MGSVVNEPTAYEEVPLPSRRLGRRAQAAIFSAF